MRIQLAATAALSIAAGALLAAPALAAGQVTQVNETSVTRAVENTPPTDDWMLYTRLGTPTTAGAFVQGPGTTPLGTGSFRTETVTGTEKVFLFNFDHLGTRLADVDEISYATYREAGSAQQVAALNLQIDFNGPAEGGFSTLVFEPVYNTDQGAVVTGEWQDWMASGSGIWWSTRPINDQCAGATAACDRTWDEIVASNPDATVLGGVGINQGSGNPGLISYTDAFTFDETTYDFELVLDADGDGVPDAEDTNSKDDCKNGGFQRFTSPVFKNQGDCVSYHSTTK